MKVHKSLVVGLLVSNLVLFGFFPVSVTVQADENEECDSFFNSCEEIDSITDVGTAISSISTGIIEKTKYEVSTFVGIKDEASSSELANELQKTFNSDSNKFVKAYNNRVSYDEATDLNVELKFVDDKGEETSKYLITDFDSNGTLESAEIVDTKPKTIDENIKLEGYAMEKSTEELEKFKEEYVETGDTVNKEYAYELLGKYGSDFDSSVQITEKIDDITIKNIRGE